jgi:hypothetical protein
MMTLEDIKQGVRDLSVEQHKQLIAYIVDLLAERKEGEPELKKRSILEFEGLGAEIWQGIDAQEYLNELRDEWDERP